MRRHYCLEPPCGCKCGDFHNRAGECRKCNLGNENLNLSIYSMEAILFLATLAAWQGWECRWGGQSVHRFGPEISPQILD